jgi:hypothetical protein
MRNRSFFFPFLLIASGLVWLLVELHTLPVENLWTLLYIWPFFLMAAGVGLILRSRWPVARMFISGLIVVGIFVAILFAPQFGWNKPPSWNFLNWTNFNGTVAGSGTIISQNRPVTDFNSIVVDYPVELTIQQGNSVSLVAEAEENLLPQLVTRVSGNTLYIENSRRDWVGRVNPTRPVKIHLTLKELQHVDFPSAGTLQVEAFKANYLEVSISGAGTMNLTNLTANRLSVNLSGAGNVTASGSIDSLNMDISGFGSFRGTDLASQSAVVNISGAGSATVWAKNNLRVDISGTGSVNYYGSPQVTRNISGLGSVNNRGNK